MAATPGVGTALGRKRLCGAEGRALAFSTAVAKVQIEDGNDLHRVVESASVCAFWGLVKKCGKKLWEG